MEYYPLIKNHLKHLMKNANILSGKEYIKRLQFYLKYVISGYV